MKRYLFRVQYTYPDGTSAYEPMCVRAADDGEAAARAEVLAASTRYPAAVGATRTATLIVATADV